MGEQLGHNYELLEPIGYGAFGRVWLAQTRDGERVAAKVLRPEYAADPTVVTRFVQERTLLGGIRHPHVVTVRDLVVEGDVLALVLDLVQGPSLRVELARRGTLPPGEASALLAQVCDGLGTLHAVGILHRDLKPENVLLQPVPGGGHRARIADFGLARLLRSTLTHAGTFVGTLEYAAPELAGPGSASGASDLYSAGIVLYEVACGVTPFAADNAVAIVQRHQHIPPGRPDGVPDPLWDVITQLLAKSPADRPASAEVVRNSLRALAVELAGLPAAPLRTDPPLADSRLTRSVAVPGPMGSAAPTVVGALPRPAGPAPVASPPDDARAKVPRHRRRVVTIAAVTVVTAAAGSATVWATRDGGRDPRPATPPAPTGSSPAGSTLAPGPAGGGPGEEARPRGYEQDRPGPAPAGNPPRRAGTTDSGAVQPTPPPGVPGAAGRAGPAGPSGPGGPPGPAGLVVPSTPGTQSTSGPSDSPTDAPGPTATGGSTDGGNPGTGTDPTTTGGSTGGANPGTGTQEDTPQDSGNPQDPQNAQGSTGTGGVAGTSEAGTGPADAGDAGTPPVEPPRTGEHVDPAGEATP